MAKILFVWELGKGFGHLAPYLDFVKALRKAGHEVVFAARDVANADRVFASAGVPILQAPLALRDVPDIHRVQYTFAYLMHNAGFADAQDLFGRVKAWLHIFNYVQPDLAIFDHSPTALLAARAFAGKRIVSGSGFLVPPPGEPLPMMRYWQKVPRADMLKVDRAVLATCNRILGALRQPPLARLSDLFEGDAQFLLTPPELDHYPQRTTGNYVGMYSVDDYGEPPAWPRAPGKRIFAYLYPFRTLPALVRALGRSNASVIIYAPEVPDGFRKKAQHPRIRWATAAQDMRRIGAECDAAVTNGTFGTTCALLNAGRPVLMVPLNLERVMVTRRVTQIGAGIGAQPGQPQAFWPRLRALLTDDRYAAAAQAYAARHAGETLAAQTQAMLATVERLLPRKGAV